ncbi:uncharacterized protein LOC144138248 isoform X2 [Haemaphysalis longicornis]
MPQSSVRYNLKWLHKNKSTSVTSAQEMCATYKRKMLSVLKANKALVRALAAARAEMAELKVAASRWGKNEDLYLPILKGWLEADMGHIRALFESHVRASTLLKDLLTPDANIALTAASSLLHETACESPPKEPPSLHPPGSRLCNQACSMSMVLEEDDEDRTAVVEPLQHIAQTPEPEISLSSRVTVRKKGSRSGHRCSLPVDEPLPASADQSPVVPSFAVVDTEASILVTEITGQKTNVVCAETVVVPPPDELKGHSAHEYSAAFSPRPKIPRTPCSPTKQGARFNAWLEDAGSSPAFTRVQRRRASEAAALLPWPGKRGAMAQGPLGRRSSMPAARDCGPGAAKALSPTCVLDEAFIASPSPTQALSRNTLLPREVADFRRDENSPPGAKTRPRKSAFKSRPSEAGLQGLFKKTKQEVAEKSELLQTTTSELQSTKNNLSAAEQVLSKTAAEKQEQAALVQAHSETEAALAATARELVTVTETTTSDIALLQQKLQRTSAIDQTNRERQSQFVSRINTLFGQVERSCSEKLATQQETLGGIESSFDQLSDIVRRHQDIVCAFTSKARRLASTSAAASADIPSSLLSIVRASQAEQAAQFGVDLASNRAGLQQLCHSLVAEHTQATRSWLSKHEAQLQALVVLATDTCRLVSTEVAKHRDQQARLTASLLEENVRLHQRLQVNDKEMERLLAAQESRSRQQAEKLSALQQHMAGFAEFFTSTQAAQREAQEQINDIRAASTEACNTQASALKSNAEELVKSSQALITDVAAIQESATRSTSEFAAKAEESLHDLSSIHTMAEDSATAEVARFSQTLANQKASTESRLADCISNVSQAVSAGAEALLCRAQEAKASADNLDSEVAEACDHLVLTCRRGSELTAATKDSADSLHVGIVDDMARCSTTVSGFFGNELQEYTPTGCTPQRREYRFPRSLPRTSPYERILSRVRLTIDGSAAVPQPGSNEIDAAPLELKEQPCSSSSADSLAANATLDKENVHRRAGKPKKVPPQTKKQLRTKNT